MLAKFACILFGFVGLGALIGCYTVNSSLSQATSTANPGLTRPSNFVNLFSNPFDLGIKAKIDEVAAHVLEKTYRFSDDMSNCPHPNGEYCNETEGPLLTPDMMTPYLGFMGCKRGYKSEAFLKQCLAECYNGTHLIDAMAAFNKQHPWKLVTFPSRAASGKETVNLTAWWLPAPRKGPTPRIILQHGNNGNYNEYYIQTAAYVLRSIGFSVIAHNLRNHGTSGKTSEMNYTTWGYDYHYDVLGAWDYAVNDPEGVLGGAVPPDQVGMMGFSMGGVIVSNAFGLESRIPGIMLDAGVINTKAVLCHQILRQVVGDPKWKSTGAVSGFMASMGLNFLMEVVKHKCGVDVLDTTPEEVIPNGPDIQRKVGIVTSALDDFVPPFDAEQWKLFAAKYPKKYDVSMFWEPASGCHGGYNAAIGRYWDYWDSHLASMPQFPDEYRERLCTFWSDVFKGQVADCGLESQHMPVLHGDPNWRRAPSGEPQRVTTTWESSCIS